MFYREIKAKYPQLQVIATTNPGPDVACDVIDNHAYMAPSAAIRAAHTYDRTNRNGPIRLVAMADVFQNRLTSSHQNLQRSHWTLMDVPETRRFIGFDADQ